MVAVARGVRVVVGVTRVVVITDEASGRAVSVAATAVAIFRASRVAVAALSSVGVDVAVGTAVSVAATAVPMLSVQAVAVIPAEEGVRVGVVRAAGEGVAEGGVMVTPCGGVIVRVTAVAVIPEAGVTGRGV